MSASVQTRGGEATRAKERREHGGLVYVLNTGEPTVSGFRIGDSRLEPLAGSKWPLPPGGDPAQGGFSPDGAQGKGHSGEVTVAGRVSKNQIRGRCGCPGLLLPHRCNMAWA